MATALSSRPYSVNSFERKLIVFQDYIHEITLRESEDTQEDRRQKILENLRFDQFSDKIRSIFGNDIKVSYVKNVFKKICSNPDANVDWSEVFGYDNSFTGVNQNTTEQGDGNTGKQDLTVNDEVQVFMITFKFRIGDASGDKARRDIIQSIHYAPDIDYFVTASQKGAITVWNNKDQTDGWTSGCCYLPNLKRIVITSERSLTFWDFRTKKQNTKNAGTMNLFSIQPINEPLTCIDCATNLNSPVKDDNDVIVFGDCTGYVMLLRINANDFQSNNTKNDLLNPDRRIISLQSLKNSFVKRKIHDEAVIRIKYISEMSSFISCSTSSKVSLAIEEIDKFQAKETRHTRSLSVNKGINTFCYCSKAHLIATGGVDKIIRLYNPIVLNKPTGKLTGHLFTIIEIVCNEKDQQLISMSSERVFRVWDLATLKCIQVFSDTEERPGEKRIYSILFDERRERLLTGSSVFDCWPLTRSVQDTTQLPHTHERPLVAVVYNSYINQIATVCTSDLKVWEAETGRIMYVINEIHGKNVEVTCMALDPSGYKLVTGASNSSIKIWDFGAGQELKHKHGRRTKEDLSITYIIYTKMNDELYVIAFGWSNKIKLFHDTNESNDLTLLRTFDDYMPLTDELINLSKHSIVERNLSASSSRKRVSVSQTVRSTQTPESRLNNQTTMSTYEQPASSFSQKSSDYQSLLNYHELRCVDMNNEANILVSGGALGELVFWDKTNKCVEKLVPFPNDYTPTAQVKRGLLEGHSVTPGSAGHLRKINCIKVIIHKTHIFEFILPKEPTIIQGVGSRPTSKIKLIRNKSNTQLTLKTNKESLISGLGSDLAANETLTKQMSRRTSHASHQSRRASKLDVSKNQDDDEEASDKANTPKAISRFVDKSYQPVIVTGHDDSTIRFWTKNGELMHEIIPPAAAITGAACTAICADTDANYLYTADARGYVTMWSIGEFIENYEASQQSAETKEQNKNTIQMLVCWKAHTNRINDMMYVLVNKTLITVSADESARVWWGNRGRYIGFLGQIKPLTIPIDDLSDWIPPYDINEPPTYSTVKGLAEKQTLSSHCDYPLVLDRVKLHQPLVLPPISPNAGTPDIIHETIQSKKFFGALMKPKHNFDNIDTINASPRKDGSVYASLPLYKEKKSDEADLKLMLLSNPYRRSRELSYISLNRILNKPRKENEPITKVGVKPNYTLATYKPLQTSNSMLSAASSRFSHNFKRMN